MNDSWNKYYLDKVKRSDNFILIKINIIYLNVFVNNVIIEKCKFYEKYIWH